MEQVVATRLDLVSAVNAVVLEEQRPKLDEGRRRGTTEVVDRLALLIAGEKLAGTSVLAHAHPTGFKATIGAPAVGLDLLGVDPAVLLEILTEVLPVLPLHLGVGLRIVLEPVFQAIIMMIGARPVAGDVGPGTVRAAVAFHGFEKETVDVVVELGVRRRLDGALGESDAARGALGHADVVQLEPMLAGQDDVGHLGAGVMEHVDVHPEIQLRESLPGQVRVGHVHERAGLVDAALQRVLALAQARLPDAGGVGPLVVVGQDGELLGADHVAEHLAAIRDVHGVDLLVGQIHRRAHGLAGKGLHALQGPLHLLGHVGARGGRSLLVHRRAGKAAVAGRAVEVARGVDEVEHRANRLGAVADLVGRQVQVDAAVAVGLALGARGPHRARLLDELRVEPGDLAGPLGGAVGHRLGEVAPHGAGDVLRAVGQRHLVLAF